MVVGVSGPIGFVARSSLRLVSRRGHVAHGHPPIIVHYKDTPAVCGGRPSGPDRKGRPPIGSMAHGGRSVGCAGWGRWWWSIGTYGLALDCLWLEPRGRGRCGGQLACRHDDSGRPILDAKVALVAKGTAHGASRGRPPHADKAPGADVLAAAVGLVNVPGIVLHGDAGEKA